jgi:hypothetical protein
LGPAEATVESDLGRRARKQVEEGPGGKQISIEDPDSNPIELHEYPRPQSP